MNKIGILGGTFDPIHNGHLYMAELAMEQADLDEVIFVPTGTVPHKDNSGITGKKHRYNMVLCAVNEYENYMVSDIEINRDGVCYTYETLKVLSKKYKNDKLYFIVGADCVFDIDEWKEPGEIFKYATLLVINRKSDTCFNIKEECQKVQKRYGGEIVLLDGCGPEISSTMIREALKKNENTEEFIPKCVYDYIAINDLYKKD
ncbi:MAG: nicotinate-nucleotide adenylyltransferase [Clostridia bacterium]|nr:nicotinate-nucleotide adenylyltransferase [Clostridia bacterium]